MFDRIHQIDSTDYLRYALNFSDEELLMCSEISSWLPKNILDCHTHCDLREHFQNVDKEMFHQMISTFVGFSLDDSKEVEKHFLIDKNVKRLRFPFPFRGVDLKSANNYLVNNVKFPDKVALCGIPDDVDYTISMLESGKFNALKMYHQQFNPPSKNIYEYFPPRVLEVAQEMEIPIILHLPKLITLCKDELLGVINKYPNLKISLAHLGLPHLPVPNLEETYKEISESGNVYMDTAMIPSKEVLIMAIKTFGVKRIMFGSDEPLNLIRSVVYHNPSLGQRIISEYPYHWVDKTEHEQYKHLAIGATHMHWASIYAIKDAIDTLFEKEKQFQIKCDIFNNNAAKFFRFADNNQYE